MEVKEYIITEADKLFCQYGFKSVTMDDIAKHLGMSKKTIYQHFIDKDELVNILMEGKLSSQNCGLQRHIEKADNAVHEMFLNLADINDLLYSMNPKLFYDLQKYHPQAWLSFKDFKEKTIGTMIFNNLVRGVNEGFYRSEIKKEILTQMRLEQIELIFSPHNHYTKNTYTIEQIIIEITQHFLYGVCTYEGLKMIDLYNKESLETSAH